MKLIKSFVPHSRCFGSYFDVIFLMYLVSSGFSFKPTSSSSSSSSTQFSQEWARRKVVVKLSIKSKSNPWKILERTCQPSFWDMLLNCYMLNVAHVTNDVKWRPIVTTFGTLIENMSRTGLYGCHISFFFLTILWAILTAVYEFYMLNVKYWRIFCDVISLLAQVFIVSVDRAYKEASTKNIKKFIWLSFCDIIVPSKSNVPSMWPLTYRWIDNDPISVLYEFQIDIATNSWEIKYQNICIGLLHVKRRTRQKWR